MFDRSWSFLSVVAALATVPVALYSAGLQPGSIGHTHILRFAQQPLSIGVKVATVTRPLDLDVLTSADFGDGEHIR